MPLTGLTEAEAARRLSEDGPNALPESGHRGLRGVVLEVLREPMFLLLLSCGGLYLVLGDPQEAVMLLGFVFAIITITVVQERRTERALDALRDLSEPKALVIREGVRRNVPAHEVVRGDLVVIDAGQRVPANGNAGTTMALLCCDRAAASRWMRAYSRVSPLRCESGSRSMETLQKSTPEETTARSYSAAPWSCEDKASSRSTRLAWRPKWAGLALRSQRLSPLEVRFRRRRVGLCGWSQSSPAWPVSP